ncbi:MAG: hypothetical protein FWH37_02985 [Candidatus Bathyarchaeota archaeon]|nr:hypothetical protein [Candidatus Termiticorpusculum sp.]
MHSLTTILIMNTELKTLTLTLILLLSSLLVLTVIPVNAQAASKPSVPQFSIKLVDNSYDISPSVAITTDPYTGKEITTSKPGSHIENIQIEVTIKNQNYPELMYNIRTKGHFEEQWREHYGISRAMFPAQSDGKYTIIKLDTMRNAYEKIYPEGAQIDFQVSAVCGTIYREMFPDGYVDDVFHGVTSDWSKTQTITITYESSTPSLSQTAAPSLNVTMPFNVNQTRQSVQIQPPNFVFHPIFLPMVVVFLFVGVVIAVVLVFVKRHLDASKFESCIKMVDDEILTPL